MKTTPIHSISSAVIRGINNAFKKYYFWSEDWLDHAPESFVVVSIGEQCAALDHVWVTAETKIRDVFKYAGAPRNGRPNSKLPNSGRFDLTLWRSNEKPRAIIEVKHPIYSGNDRGLLSDVKRICKLLEKCGDQSSIQFGGVAFYTSSDSPQKKHANSTQRLKSYLSQLQKNVRTIAAVHGCKAKVKHGRIFRPRGVGDAWVAGFIEILR